MRLVKAFLLLAFLVPTAAHAAWREASSPNFVVYADDSERDIRRFSEQLELYHAAMKVLTGIDPPEPSPSSRLTVFVVKNEQEVRRLLGEGARYVSGFYIPRASGSIAVVPRINVRRGAIDFAMLVLLHEYAHHFMTSNGAFVAPRWLGEGGAEFFASAEFSAAGGIKIGMPARHRVAELFYAKDVKAEELLDPDAYADGARRGYDAFYGRSWLLYHYLTFGEDRKGQMQTYLGLLTAGRSARDAALEAFGDFQKLDRDMDRYLGQRRILSVAFPPGVFDIGAVDVRQLNAGEAAVMPLFIRSRRGVNEEQAAALVAEIRQVAETFPDEPAVLAALAEAEFDAGHDRQAIEAADRALALDGTRVNAYVQKGYALFRQASEADDADEAYKAAVSPFIALNKIENNHPLPLIYYFRSYVERGISPPDLAVRGLERAVELAPFDQSLRLELATHQLSAGQFDRARGNLLPLAYNPHGGSMAEAARRVVERIDSSAEGEVSGTHLLAILTAPEVEAEADE